MKDTFIDDFVRKAEELGLTGEILSPECPIVFDENSPPGLRNTIEYVSKVAPCGVYLRLHIKGKQNCSSDRKTELLGRIVGWEHFVEQTYELYLRDINAKLLFGVKISSGRITELLPAQKENERALFKIEDDCKSVVFYLLSNYSALLANTASLSQRQ